MFKVDSSTRPWTVFKLGPATVTPLGEGLEKKQFLAFLIPFYPGTISLLEIFRFLFPKLLFAEPWLGAFFIICIHKAPLANAFRVVHAENQRQIRHIGMLIDQ